MIHDFFSSPRRTLYAAGVEQTESPDATSATDWRTEKTRLTLPNPATGGALGTVAFTEAAGFELKYYLRDHLGSIVALVDAELTPGEAMDTDDGDGSFNTVWQAFDAWGAPRDPETWNAISPETSVDPGLAEGVIP